MSQKSSNFLNDIHQFDQSKLKKTETIVKTRKDMEKFGFDFRDIYHVANEAPLVESNYTLFKKFGYGFKDGKWKELLSSPLEGAAIEVKDIEKPPKKMLMVTWNVWFSNFRWKERYTHILKLMEDLNPDLMAFQEVIPPFLDIFCASQWVQQNYIMSDVSPGNNILPYGTLLVIRKTLGIKRFVCYEYPSTMGRDFKAVELEMDMQLPKGNDNAMVPCDDNNKQEKHKKSKNERTVKKDELKATKSFLFATSHLESLNNPQLRYEQMCIARNVFSKLKPNGGGVFCGDFNFDSSRNYFIVESMPLENDKLKEALPYFDDVWPTLKGPNDKGFTFNSNKNFNINHVEIMRYDRIMIAKGPFPESDKNDDVGDKNESKVSKLNSKRKLEEEKEENGGYWTAKSISIIGNKPFTIKREDKNNPGRYLAFGIWPSDHFGLSCELEWRE